LAVFVLAACGGSGQHNTAASNAATSSAATTAKSSAATAANSSAASSQNANGNGAYLGQFTNGIVYMVWANARSGLTGTVYTDFVQTASDGTESVDSQSGALTGTVNGSAISLSVPDLGLSLTGTLRGHALEVFNYPGEQAGSVVDVTLQQSSTSGYDSTLSTLQSGVNSNNTSVQQQQQSQTTANQVQQAASAVSSDIAQLTSDAQQSASNDETTLYASDLRQEQTDVAQTNSDMQQVLNEVGSTDSGTLCSDAGTVQSDVGTVESDVGTIQSDQGSAQSDESSIDGDLTQLQQADSVLETDRANTPGDIPPDAPSAHAVEAAIASAKRIEHRINGASSSALASAQALLQQAQGYQKPSDAACNAAPG
jgi:hypothetical protein